MVVTSVPCVVIACFILHNMCEIHREVFDNDWLQEAARISQLVQPTATPHQDGGEETLIKFVTH